MKTSSLSLTQEIQSEIYGKFELRTVVSFFIAHCSVLVFLCLQS